MPAASLPVDGTLQDAIEALAKMAADGRTQRTKQADLNSVVEQVRDTLGNNPMLAHALAGGVVGAGLGGLNTATSDEKHRNLLGSMLTGGLAGAGLGAGISAARSGLGGLMAGRRAAPETPGVFADPSTGKTMAISPEAIKAQPNLTEAVNDASNITSPTELAGRAMWNTTKGIARNAPWGTWPALGALGYDQAVNSDRLRLGERHLPRWLGGGRLPGMIDPRHSNIREHFLTGIDHILKENKPGQGWSEDHLKALQKMKNMPLEELNPLIERANSSWEGTPFKVPIPTTEEIPQAPVTRTERSYKTVDMLDSSKRPVIDPATGHPKKVFIPDAVKRRPVEQLPLIQPGPDDMVEFPDKLIQDIRLAGATARAEAASKNKFLSSAGLVSSTPRMQRGLFGTQREKLLTRLHPARLVPRAVGLAALPAASIMADSYFGNQHKQRNLAEIINSLQQKGLIKEAP